MGRQKVCISPLMSGTKGQNPTDPGHSEARLCEALRVLWVAPRARPSQQRTSNVPARAARRGRFWASVRLSADVHCAQPQPAQAAPPPRPAPSPRLFAVRRHSAACPDTALSGGPGLSLGSQRRQHKAGALWRAGCGAEGGPEGPSAQAPAASKAPTAALFLKRSKEGSLESFKTLTTKPYRT